MCNFKIWAKENDDLFVMQCTDCNVFQMRISHLCLIYHDDHYQKFQESVNNAFEILESGKEDMFVIPTLNGEMNLLLNKKELQNLYTLIDSADTEMQAARFAGMFA